MFIGCYHFLNVDIFHFTTVFHKQQHTYIKQKLKYLKVTIRPHSDTILNVFKCVTFLPVKGMKLHFFFIV